MLVYLEPSSVLADRVMHAVDNPSPPPSPTLPLSFFDPYHTTTPQSPTDYRNDLFLLSINNRPEHDHDNPLLLSTTIDSKAQTSDNLPSQVLQQELISFDSVPTLQPKEANTSSFLKEAVSVDDLISHCPISLSPGIQQNLKIPDLVVEPPLENLLVDMDLDKTVGVVGEDSNIVPHNSEPQLGQLGILLQPSNVETPVRRSTRPRKSVTPNVAPPPAVFSLPPSGARTQIKKKLTPDEFVDDDSQEEQGVEEKIVQRALTQTGPSALWSARQRSPTRSPMSFNRVLGSLSPKSSDLLAKLAFTPNEESNNMSVGNDEPSDSRTPFTFSIFPTLSQSVPESLPPNTPSHPTGPIRFSSPTRSTSPHKIRLQMPAPNDPMNTPARRIPIEQGIAQGHVSPQKAAQLGFKSDGTPLTSILTPARRVLVSEPSIIPRPDGIRFGKPSKGKEREQSMEPGSRPVIARRKEKETASEQSSTETLAKSWTAQPDTLPFLLVASNPAPSTSSSMVPETCQSNLTPAKPTIVKSYLRQPTSRIPKIGAKPYARPPTIASRQKDSSTPPKKIAGLAKVSCIDYWHNTSILTLFLKTLRKSTTMESAFIPQNTNRIATSSISRVKQTSTSLLKRKRETEKPSPVKPRIITLRQVPKVVLPTTTSSKSRIEPPTIPNLRQTPQNSVLRPGKVMDSGSSKVLQSMPQEQEAPIIVYNPRPAETDMKSPEAAESSPCIPPGSPMMQDPPCLLHDLVEPQSKPGLIIPDIPTPETSSTSNLRRTTRSRRTAVNEGSSQPLPTRRKPPSSRSDDVFSGMSITALKDLTTSNTARNQEYLIAKLETEVVRKEGVRPESPAVKIRTIVQRQMEDKLKERAERASRRARRSDGDMMSSDIEGFSDVGYSSPCEDRFGESSREPLPRHRRGPGDEEDYETPERPDQHKETRLFVEADDQGGEPERRVKWDRGLFTAVYLDEVKLGSRQPLKENRSLKGILAPTAKVRYSILRALWLSLIQVWFRLFD